MHLLSIRPSDMSGKVLVLLTSVSTNNRVVTINLKSENLSRGSYFRVSLLNAKVAKINPT